MTLGFGRKSEQGLMLINKFLKYDSHYDTWEGKRIFLGVQAVSFFHTVCYGNQAIVYKRKFFLPLNVQYVKIYIYMYIHTYI